MATTNPVHCRARCSRARMRVALLAGLAAAVLASPTHAGLGTAVEFYNATLDHYFITAYPEEAAALDAGTNVKGWARTGGQFAVFTEPADGLAAVCRFFGTPNVGPNSHFYTADPAECAKVKTLPAWTFEGIAFYIPLPTSGQCGGNWPVYRSYYSDQISDANHRFTVDPTAHARMPARRGDILEGLVMCAPVTDEEREADAVRFLEQATLGPTEALVQEVKSKGIAKWLDEQLALNVTRYTQHPWVDWKVAPPCVNDTTPPATPEKYCFMNKAQADIVAREFYRQSLKAPDQLRLRMAHVWHQVFVFSSQSGGWDAHPNANFHQRLRDGAFETFESLLTRYTLSPQLGLYQSWARNAPERDGIRPNENYARELLQLFTIGVTELNDDGTPKRDAAGRPVPTYAQSDIETVARILTGYTYPTQPGNTPGFWANWIYYTGDMIPFDEFHDQGAKYALGGRIAMPAGGTAAAEVAALLHGLVMHPNTPPFISRQLIQKMVTSSPTPGYVSRVASVFKDNGRGVRGDLAAVTRAILLDPEARGARKIDSEYGRLREPVLFWTSMLRALDVTTDGLAPSNAAGASGQQLFAAPTVFNYYPADFVLATGNVPAPEFGIYTSLEFLNRANQVNDLLYNVDQSWTNWGPQPYLANALGTLSPPLSAFLPDAANPDALVDRLDRLLTHGALSPAARKTIVNAVSKVSAVNALRRVKLALNLMLVSFDYQVQK